jgi:hypothetical protein
MQDFVNNKGVGMRKQEQKMLGRITVDRKIVEMFRDGKTASNIVGKLTKGKGYVIKTRDLAEQYGYIEKISDEPKIFRATGKVIPPFPAALFPIIDLRKDKTAETDAILEPHRNWILVGLRKLSLKKSRLRFQDQIFIDI